MIDQYVKGRSIELGRNFFSSDLDCRCSNVSCTTTFIDSTLISALDELWELIGEFKINSGYRCKKHNTSINGEKNSLHLVGKAVDIESSRGLTGPEMSKYVLQIPDFEKGGLGVAEHWLHCDVRGTRARWTYPISTH